MKKNRSKNDKLSDLRKRAEWRLELESTSIDNLSDVDVRKLAHELHVHQIELEMQNNELRKDQIIISELGKKYSDLYDFAPVGYLTLDENGKILDANLAELTSKIVRDFKDGTNKLWIIINDITERKLVEESLIKIRNKADAAHLAKSTFLANMGNELRTPLNAVTEFLELLKNYKTGNFNEKQKKHLDDIQKSRGRIVDMIKDILDLSEAGRMELVIEEFSLSNLLHNMVTIIKPSLY